MINAIEKGGDSIARKSWTNTYDSETLEAFKRKCEEDRLPANMVLEMLMKLYLRGEFELGMIAKKDK